MADFWERYSRSRSAVLGLGILGLVIFMAAIAHMIFPEDPFRLAGRPLSLPGTNGFLLGSDVLGRDVAAGHTFSGLCRRPGEFGPWSPWT